MEYFSGRRQRQVYDLRLKGLCCFEIAEKLEMKPKQVRSVAISIGMPFTEEEKQRSKQLGAEKSILNQYGTLEERNKHNADYIEKHHPDFEWMDGMVSGNKSVKLRCKQCGNEITRSGNSIRGHKKIRCRYCAEIQKEKSRVEAEVTKKAAQIEKERQSVLKKSFIQMAFSFCPECGNVFIKSKENKKYCSNACMKRSNNSYKKDKRVRKIRKKSIDRGINIQKLYKRDNGICWLCGETCDFNDYHINDNGSFIVGYNYPSIDHIFPLSKGGQHSWDNVKLAHHYCNTIKNDKVVSA